MKQDYKDKCVRCGNEWSHQFDDTPHCNADHDCTLWGRGYCRGKCEPMSIKEKVGQIKNLVEKIDKLIVAPLSDFSHDYELDRGIGAVGRKI